MITRRCGIAYGLPITLLLLSCAASAASRDRAYPLNIGAGSLDEALNLWAQQTGYSVLVSSSSIADSISARKKVVGTFTAEEALQELLDGTALEYEFVNAKTVAVVSAKPVRSTQTAARNGAFRVAEASQEVPLEGENKSAVPDSPERERRGIPEVLISGSRSLNSDIRRTEDDAQPYVVIDRELIEKSGATNLDVLLRQKLPMATNSVSPAAEGSGYGAVSRINLRGLGSDETLILIDGRRIAAYGDSSGVNQPDVNSIPLSAIERVEVLPATASGIYGGGATGGAINIVMRHDYSGIDTKVSYGSAFGGASNRSVDLSGGFNIGSKTNVMLSASWSDSNGLLTSDRDFLERARDLILRNNPAAVYGSSSPPVGATTNIISATSVGGVLQPLTLKNGGGSLNSTFTSVPYGYAGINSDGGGALKANAGRYNLDVPNSVQRDSYAFPTGGRSLSLINAPTVKSVLTNIHYALTNEIATFLELSASENEGAFQQIRGLGILTIPASAPGNPFNQAIRIAAPSVGIENETQSSLRSLRGTAGLTAKLSKSWSLGIDYVWNQTKFEGKNALLTFNTTRAATAVGSGALDLFRDTNSFPTDLAPFLLPTSYGDPARDTLRNISARASGEVFNQLPAGPLRLTAMFEHRKEVVGDMYQFVGTASPVFPSGYMPLLSPAASQSVGSAYFEALFPIISAKQRLPLVDTLEVQLAVRRDQYKTIGTTTSRLDANLQPLSPVAHASNEVRSTDPTVALRYAPAPDITFRGSYGTGFLPPSINLLASNIPQAFPFGALGLRDPLRQNELLGNSILLTSGGNANLNPEESKSRSIGVILTPKILHGLRVSVDWVDIKKDHNIGSLNVTSQVALNDLIALFPDRVTRGAASNGFAVGPITAIDATLLNLAKLHVKSYDIAADYNVNTDRWGELSFHLGATHVTSLATQLTADSRVEEYAGVGTAGAVGISSAQDGGALKWTGLGALTWRVRSTELGWTARYSGSYYFDPSHTFNVNQGSASIPSQLYHDIFIAYGFPTKDSGVALLNGLQVQFGVNNLFNKAPPLDVVGRGSSPSGYSYYGDPRRANYYLTIRKAFSGR